MRFDEHHQNEERTNGRVDQVDQESGYVSLLLDEGKVLLGDLREKRNDRQPWVL
jgi:hypothetical protein